jgi:hypothetical protein
VNRNTGAPVGSRSGSDLFKCVRVGENVLARIECRGWSRKILKGADASPTETSRGAMSVLPGRGRAGRKVKESERRKDANKETDVQ